MIVLLMVFLALAAYYLFRPCIRPRNFPPGPMNFPLLGGVPYLGADMTEAFTWMQAKYGNLFSFNMGSTPVIVVADYHLYKEIANRDEFSSRPNLGPILDTRYPDAHQQVRGVMFSNGDEWKEVRRFSMRHLRDFGFGKSSMEGLIHDEVDKCLELVRREVGTETCLKFKLNIPILNALWKIISGEALSYDDPKLHLIVSRLNDMMTSVDIAGPLNLFHWLKHVAPKQTGYEKIVKTTGAVYELIDEQFKDHLETFESNNLRDFIDVYINEMKSVAKPGSSFYDKKGRQNLDVLLMDFFIAGSETTTSTLNWTIYYLALHPEKQRRLQREIEEAVTGDRKPSLSDRPNMPYMEAVITEINRIASLGYTGVPRMVTQDTTLAGYNIPKGTIVFSYLYHILRDPLYWTRATEFYPERFLTEDGQFKRDERAISFGLGKRGCVGKTLAENELFLFGSAMFQNFDFELPEKKPDHGMKPTAGFVLGCPAYNIKITERRSRGNKLSCNRAQA